MRINLNAKLMKSQELMMSPLLLCVQLCVQRSVPTAAASLQTHVTVSPDGEDWIAPVVSSLPVSHNVTLCSSPRVTDVFCNCNLAVENTTLYLIILPQV